MDARTRIEAYYDTLRKGEPLTPFFASDESLVKVGISERLVGDDAVRDGLREQTRTTEDWTIESRDLCVTERDAVAWFSDDVGMAWTDRKNRTRHQFASRWSGTLEFRAEPSVWVFVGMHVSAPREL